jgi:hypothetical protein
MTDPTTAISPALTDQPHAIVERDGVRYTLLGTAHVSRASVDAVQAAIADGGYDTIAVELDPQRLIALTDPEALARLDLVKVLREGKTALFAANLGLAATNVDSRTTRHRTGRRIEGCGRRRQGPRLAGAPDRSRCRPHLQARSQRLGWWDRAKLGGGLVASLFADEDVGPDGNREAQAGRPARIQLRRIREDSPALYETVIAERDRYMAARLRESANAAEGRAKCSAVVGAGHLQGMAKHLREDKGSPLAIRAELEHVKEKSSFPVVHADPRVLRDRRIRVGLLAWRLRRRRGADAVLGADHRHARRDRVRGRGRSSAEHPRRVHSPRR